MMRKFIIAVCTVCIPYMCLAQDKLVKVKELVVSDPYFKEAHASTLTETTTGDIIVAFFAGTKEANPDVEIMVSKLIKGKWTPPKSVANGIQHSKKRYPTWNPVLYQIPHGKLQLYYKVGPSPQTWWGELIESADGGETWSKPRRLPEDILGPIKNKPVLLSNGVLLSPVSTEVKHDAGWKIHFEATKDYGDTWELYDVVDSSSSINAIQPSILIHKEGLQLLARSLDDGIVESWSYDNGKSWTPLKSTGLLNPNSGTDAVTVPNKGHVLVYNNIGKPAERWSGPRSPLNVAVSKDGKSWKDILILEEPQRGEFSYPSVIVDRKGDIHITYTYKRKNVMYVHIDGKKIKY
ncbi:sialidase family protein [Sphingobacterium sp. SGG-5]|uniref:sialidase family protein n=1 Tax=Sphingobacterium sp. SGG-5 TaxID=2710881 RepID=UPI0019D2AA50|nr:sialidase family protein [Sphingobacterium sp. SGG-5]